tara:strand:+ start:5231 stop:5641 length:411 start_codon:yes stop_codon:yes gene_type:complete
MDILGIGNILSGIIKPAGDIIDDLTTSDEERLEAKRKLTEIISSAEAVAQKEVSERWTADMQSGNWLAANIRPLSLIFLTAVFAVLSVTDGNIGDFTIGDAYKPIYQTLLLTVYGAYFAGRSIEKIKGKSDPIKQK